MAKDFVEIPVFTGHDLRGWINWLIEFFDREQFTDDDDKLNFTQSFMEGDARAWFFQHRNMEIFESWDELKRSLLLRFGRYDDPERINAVLEGERRCKELQEYWKIPEATETTMASTFQVDSIQETRDSVTTLLERIPSPTCPDLMKSKGVAESSSPHVQVSNSSLKPDPETESLGYRINHLVFETHGGLAKRNGASTTDKFEMPMFDGFMPYSWILQVERYFRAGQYSEATKLDWVSASLEGDVLDWYNEEISREVFMNWSEFKKRMLARFAPDRNNFPAAKILKKDSAPKSVLQTELGCDKATSTTLEKNILLEATESHIPNCVLRFEKVKSTKCETFQVASSNCSGDSLESHSGQLFAALPGGTDTGDIFVHNREESYVVQIQKEAEFAPQSTYLKLTLNAYKVYDRKLLRGHKIQNKKKKRISPKSWRFKYISVNMTKMRLHKDDKHSRLMWDEMTSGFGRARWCVSQAGKLKSLHIEDVTAWDHQAGAISDKYDAKTDYAEVKRLADVHRQREFRNVVGGMFEIENTEQHHGKGILSIVWLIKLPLRSHVHEKCDNWPWNMLFLYFTIAEKDYFAVRHCWKERKRRRKKWMDLQSNQGYDLLRGISGFIAAKIKSLSEHVHTEISENVKGIMENQPEKCSL